MWEKLDVPSYDVEGEAWPFLSPHAAHLFLPHLCLGEYVRAWTSNSLGRHWLENPDLSEVRLSSQYIDLGENDSKDKLDYF